MNACRRRQRYYANAGNNVTLLSIQKKIKSNSQREFSPFSGTELPASFPLLGVGMSLGLRTSRKVLSPLVLMGLTLAPDSLRVGLFVPCHSHTAPHRNSLTSGYLLGHPSEAALLSTHFSPGTWHLVIQFLQNECAPRPGEPQAGAPRWREGAG